MAYWDSVEQKTVRFPPRPYPGYPGWAITDCGCCNGIAWGGESPEECSECNGSGTITTHVESGVQAMYPGGPFC